MNSLRRWLEALGLGEYAAAFEDNAVDALGEAHAQFVAIEARKYVERAESLARANHFTL